MSYHDVPHPHPRQIPKATIVWRKDSPYTVGHISPDGFTPLTDPKYAELEALEAARLKALWSKPWLSPRELQIYLDRGDGSVRRFVERYRIRRRSVGSRTWVVARADVDRVLRRRA